MLFCHPAEGPTPQPTSAQTVAPTLDSRIPPPGEEAKRLARKLSKRGYAIDYGFISANNNSDPSQGPDTNYLAPNPTAIYCSVSVRPPLGHTQPDVPPLPIDPPVPGYSPYIRAKSSEVFIIWLRTPPHEYFVFNSQLMYQELNCLQNITKKAWFPVATSSSIPLDFTTLNFTEGGEKTLEAALDQDMVLVVSADQNLAESVAAELGQPNVNVLPFSLSGGGEGWTEDAAVTVMFLRATYSAMSGSAEMQKYMKQIQDTAVVMRATNTGEAPTPKLWELVPPEPSAVDEVALGYGKYQDEIRETLLALAQRLEKKYDIKETGDVENCPLSKTGQNPDDCVPLPTDLPCTPMMNPLCLPGKQYAWKYNCCKPQTFCPPGGELLTYYQHPATPKMEDPGSFVVVYGLNHVATGLSHYTSLTLYDSKSFFPFYGQTHREMVNSAAAFTTTEAVNFSYAFIYARDCALVRGLDPTLEDAQCIEIPTAWPGFPFDVAGYLQERQYHVPPPPADHVVHAAAMHFKSSGAEDDMRAPQ